MGKVFSLISRLFNEMFCKLNYHIMIHVLKLIITMEHITPYYVLQIK